MNRHDTALQMIKDGAVIPAIPLVLDKNRKFNPDGQRRLIRYYLAAGVDGLAVAVHTTQFEIREKGIDLFEPVLKIAKEEFNRFEEKTGKVVIQVAGVCGEASQAVKEAEFVKSLDFDAVLLSPGGLNHLSENDMILRTKAVAEQMPVIGFYLQTSVGGRRFSFDYWKAVADVPNVIAIKAASFNRYQTIDLVRGVVSSNRRDEISLYTGNDDNIVVDLLTKYRFTINGTTYEKGFVGGLLGHWSVWTQNVVNLFSNIKKVRNLAEIPAEMLTLAAEVTDANGAFFDVANGFAGCIAGVHEVLRRQGIIEGIWCLNPDETLSPGQKEEIDRVYDMYPHLNDDSFVADFLSAE